MGGVKKKKCIFSLVCQLEVQGSSELVSSETLLLVFADGYLPLVCVSVLILPPKDASQTGLGPTHVTSFYPGYLIKGPISKCGLSLCYWGLGLQNLRGNKFRGNALQPQIPLYSRIKTQHPKGNYFEVITDLHYCT